MTAPARRALAAGGPAAALLLVALLPGGLAPAHAAPRGPAESEPLEIAVDATFLYEYYDVGGDPAAALYPFLDSQPSLELDLRAEKRLSRYQHLRAGYLALINDSEYRSPFDGLVSQRISLAWENGDSPLPFRVEGGDFFAYLTHRTSERALKGVQLDLQPRLDTPGRRLSLLVTAGSYSSSWRDIRFADDWSTGISGVYEDPSLGRYSLGFLHNRRDPRDDSAGEREQDTVSVAGTREFLLGSETMRLEGELAWLSETAAPVADAGGGDERDDQAAYLQLSGRGRSPFSYRLRYEDYGEAYAPAGAPIPTDRRSGEVHLGWRLPTGAEVRWRAQRYLQARSSSNPLDQDVFGLSIAGPLLGGRLPGFGGYLEWFTDDLNDTEGVLDRRTNTVVADVYHRLQGTWSPRLQVFWQDQNDRRPEAPDRDTLQVQMRSDHRGHAFGLEGTISPGVLLRRQGGAPGNSRDWTPTLDLSLGRGAHSFRQAFSLASLNPDGPDGPDAVATWTLAYRAAYRYLRQRFELGLELDAARREPAPGDATRSYRAAGYVTYRFRTARARREPAPGAIGAERRLEEASGPFDLLELAPGSALQAVTRRLERAGFAAAAPGDVMVYEARLLDAVERQRLALVAHGGTLARAAVLIDVDRDLLETYARVREVVIGRYGRPDTFFEEGEAGGDVREDVRQGRFIRILEWYRPEGVLRLGIPRRLDGLVRIELQLAEDFPSLRDTMWSIEEVR